MTNSEQPEADALEQRRGLLDDLSEEQAELADAPGPEIFEVDPADALEQHRLAGSADDDDDYPSG